MILAWAGFLALGAVIFAAGYRLSRYGDVIAERTGLSGSWIGLILMATVTSLPELATGIGSVRITHSPDLAVGDVLGSCMFNLLILALIDVVHRPAPVFARASEGHALSAGYGTILLGTVGLSLLAPEPWPGAPIGAGTVVILGGYMLALRTIFTFERRRLLEPAEPAVERHRHLTLRKAVVGYALAGSAVVAAGLALPVSARAVAEVMGWTDSLVGTIFLAAATSLPEAAVTLSAVRIGAVDMAIANLLGSNLFNMLVLALDDLAYYEGPLLDHASSAHLTSVLVALLMNGVVVAGLIYRSGRRPAGVMSWASIALVGAYALNVWFLFAGGPQT